MADDRRDVFLRGIEAYGAGEHYESHEIWEQIWQDEPDEDTSRMLQALIQIASAVHKARNDVAPRGAIRLCERALERLAELPDIFLGIDVTALRAGARELARAVEQALGESGHCRLGAEVAPVISLASEVPRWPETDASAVPAVASSSSFSDGLTAYRAGEYFEAHEKWEALWRDERDEDHKQFLQGLIQLAAAMHKVQTQHKPEPAGRLLHRAMMRLSVFPADYFGLRVDRILREARRAQQALEGCARGGEGVLAAELVPTIEPIGN